MISPYNALFDTFHPDLEQMSARFSPITISVTRKIVESQHLVDCAVMGRDGLQMAFGDVERGVIARSSIKPIQVIALVSSGAAAAFGFGAEHIALAAASHSGEAEHLDRVRSMLDKIGLDETALECGAARPLGKAAADNVVASGEPFGRIHNCCSGKHAGFLAIARHLGVDHAGYSQPDHRVQRLVTQSISTFSRVDLSTQAPGIDGCGIPTYGIPLANLAAAMLHLGSPDLLTNLDQETTDACRSIVEALGSNPFWMSGTGREEMTLAERANQPLVAKIGAEGVFMALLPDQEVGVALKVRDGAERAACLAIEAVLEQLGALAPRTIDPIVTNAEGTVVGSMDASWS